MIQVAVHNAHGSRRVEARRIRTIVRRLLTGERRHSAKVSLVFIGDTVSRRLNRKFFAHDRATDVMSFPLEVGGDIEGEIYVNLDKATRQARTYRVSLANETARLVIHGVLHLVGYDDVGTASTHRMKKREEFYVGRLAGKDSSGR